MDNNENKNKKSKKIIGLIFLLVLLIVIGCLLIAAVKNAGGEEGQIKLNGMVRSETLYVLVISLLLVPVLLFLLVGIFIL